MLVLLLAVWVALLIFGLRVDLLGTPRGFRTALPRSRRCAVCGGIGLFDPWGKRPCHRERHASDRADLCDRWPCDRHGRRDVPHLASGGLRAPGGAGAAAGGACDLAAGGDRDPRNLRVRTGGRAARGVFRCVGAVGGGGGDQPPRFPDPDLLSLQRQPVRVAGSAGRGAGCGGAAGCNGGGCPAGGARDRAFRAANGRKAW